jgi:hypothetical protein
MRILLDMNLSPRWGPVLKDLGHECRHWSDIGDPRATDATIMAWARSHDQVVLTHDLDFGAILAATEADALTDGYACRAAAEATKGHESARIRKKPRPVGLPPKA